MTPYDDLIARISDLIRDGDRTVEKRAEDIVGAVREYATTDAKVGQAIVELIRPLPENSDTAMRRAILTALT